MPSSDRPRDPDDGSDASGPTAGPRAAGPAASSQYRRVVDLDELARRLLVHEWVIDVRPRAAFAAAHLSNALNFELGSGFGPYLNRLYEWGSPLTLIAQTAREAQDARRQLRELGISRLVGAAIGCPEEVAGGRPLTSYPVTDFVGLTAALGDYASFTVLDVRSDEERERGGVRGSLHLPIQRLSARLKDVPQGEVWVYSGSGYRAAVAASMLACRSSADPDQRRLREPRQRCRRRRPGRRTACALTGRRFDEVSAAPSTMQLPRTQAAPEHPSGDMRVRVRRRDDIDGFLRAVGSGDPHRRKEDDMCRAVTCKVCSKTTWAGCGQHVDHVMRGVPAAQRCPGHQREAPARTGFFSRLFARG